MTPETYDAVVLGAGPAGLATAIALRRLAPLSVLVVDAAAPDRERIGESAAPDLLGALDRLGLAERFQAGGHAACPGSASIWGDPAVGYNDYVLSPIGPAWRLDRRQFDAMLAEAAVTAGASLRWHTRFVRRAGPVVHLRTRSGRMSAARARCVVDATGPAASYARAMGARRCVDDRLVAVARVGTAGPDASTLQTLVEAVDGGWWYGARLPDDRTIAMFVTDRAGVRTMRAGGEHAFDEALARTDLVAKMAPQGGGRIRLVPVHSSVLDRTEDGGWIAVGDAAASYDPIAAQGISKALRDGALAAGRVAAALAGTPAPDTGDTRAAAVADYRRNRAYLYALERRFPDSPFWAARRARSVRAITPGPGTS